MASRKRKEPVPSKKEQKQENEEKKKINKIDLTSSSSSSSFSSSSSISNNTIVPSPSLPILRSLPSPTNSVIVPSSSTKSDNINQIARSFVGVMLYGKGSEIYEFTYNGILEKSRKIVDQTSALTECHHGINDAITKVDSHNNRCGYFNFGQSTENVHLYTTNELCSDGICHIGLVDNRTNSITISREMDNIFCPKARPQSLLTRDSLRFHKRIILAVTDHYVIEHVVCSRALQCMDSINIYRIADEFKLVASAQVTSREDKMLIASNGEYIIERIRSEAMGSQYIWDLSGPKVTSSPLKYFDPFGISNSNNQTLNDFADMNHYHDGNFWLFHDKKNSRFVYGNQLKLVNRPYIINLLCEYPTSLPNCGTGDTNINRVEEHVYRHKVNGNIRYSILVTEGYIPAVLSSYIMNGNGERFYLTPCLIKDKGEVQIITLEVTNDSSMPFNEISRVKIGISEFNEYLADPKSKIKEAQTNGKKVQFAENELDYRFTIPEFGLVSPSIAYASVNIVFSNDVLYCVTFIYDFIKKTKSHFVMSYHIPGTAQNLHPLAIRIKERNDYSINRITELWNEINYCVIGIPNEIISIIIKYYGGSPYTKFLHALVEHSDVCVNSKEEL